MTRRKWMGLCLMLVACSQKPAPAPPSTVTASTPPEATAPSPAGNAEPDPTPPASSDTLATLATLDAGPDAQAPGLAATADTDAAGSGDAGSAASGSPASHDTADKGTADTQPLDAEPVENDTDRAAAAPADLATLLADMKRAPSPETAARLTGLGHVGIFRGPDLTLLTSGLPATSPDGLIAIAGPPTVPFGANGDPDLDPEHLVVLRTDGTVLSSLPLSRDVAYEEVDDTTLTRRLEAAQALLSKHTWETMKPMVEVEWSDDENPATSAFYAPDGSAVFELSKWSVTADLAVGRWRKTLPELPRQTFRDDQGSPCDVIRFATGVYVAPSLEVALVSLGHSSMNSLCAIELTMHTPLKLPGAAGGEGWKPAKRGNPPPWFETLTGSIHDADFLGEDGTLEPEDRQLHEAFIAVWGDRYPRHKSVMNARKVLEADQKNRSRPTTP